MATESPMRMVDSTGVRQWPSSMETVAFTSSGNMAAEELGLLLKGHGYQVNRREVLHNRSGSAPPSMEGSLASIGNLIAQQNSIVNASLENLRVNCESEEQLRADPAYLAYYCSNVNLNPRLPPPLISRENRRLVRHIGGFGSNQQLSSFDDNSYGGLSTHKEESEDDKSPRQACDVWAEQDAFLSGRHKSLVDLIQEDFPRTPSPVYNQQLISNQAQEAMDPDGLNKPLRDSSISTTKLSEFNVDSIEICEDTPSSRVHTVRSISHSDSSTDTVPRPLSPEETGSPRPGRKGRSSNVDIHVEDGSITAGLNDSNITSIESDLKDFSISSRYDNKNQSTSMQHQQHHHLRSQPGATNQIQGPQPQIPSQGIHRSYIGMDQVCQRYPKLSAEVQPLLQSSGMAPPLYATTTAYMASGAPFYPSLHPPGLLPPPYGLGGYALNTTLFPPFITGYSPHTSVPMGFDPTAGPSFNNARTTVVSTGGSIAPGVDFQHPYKFYGQPGLAMQPFVDPVFMQYFQHLPEGPYGTSNPYDPTGLRGNNIRGQVEVLDAQRGRLMASYTAEHKPQYQRGGGLTVTNINKAGMSSPNYYGSTPSMGVLMQLPTSLGHPVIPPSPIGEMGLPGRSTDTRFPPGSGRNTGTYYGWQGQKGTERFDDPKTLSFLEELKSNKARKFEISDIAGRIVEFSADQHGSRFIQQKLENCSIEEKSSVFKEVIPYASKLMTDVFGNYVIQKFFEHGSPEQRKELADQLTGHIVPLSLQMYGCRVIQKALEVIDLDQKTQLVHELDGHVMKCVRDQNGNHVIQKCIECVPTEKIGFIISAFRGQVAALSTHPYGCRMIQRVLEYCTDELQNQCIVDEILESACALAEDQYGNYVTQHILERGKPNERSQIIKKLAGKIVQMSQHKFASNVVEKCLAYADPAEQEVLIEEIVGQTEGNDNLLIMMKDQFANYVIQKILEICTDKQRDILSSRIRVHLHALKKYTYGKHIVVRFEQLSGEEDRALET